ncbi:MAG: hypothetical protein ACYS17_06445 [Planctomycetota bacterium]
MPKKLKTSANNRKCAFPHCEHHLSIYNHEAYCHVHREQMHEGRKSKAPYHHPS